MYGKGKPPVKVGDELEVKIISQGSKGDGVSRVEGFVIFVPNGQVDKKYKVSVSKVLPNMAFAEIVEEVE